MNPRDPLFVDSVYLIGLTLQRDQWRAASLAAAPLTANRQLYTSDGVFQEVLAHVAREHSHIRARAAAMCRRMQDNRSVVVVHHSQALLAAALTLYDGEFRFTSLSLQDCIAIHIMRTVGISEILTADQEFALAGMTPLLRRYI